MAKKTSFVTAAVGPTPPPTITLDTGAGTGATGSVDGADSAGQITVNTAGIPAPLARVASIAFGAAYGVAPTAVILTPANQAASELGGGSIWVANTSLATTGFDLRAPTAPLVTATTYIWYFQLVF